MKLKLQTMHNNYKEDGENTSDHLMCPNCGRCITCDDCECEMKKEWIKRGYVKDE
jgi:Fe2+ or Zn2+ uptake regulation protein